MTAAAGVLLLAPGDKALFLRRTEDAPDYPGHWDFPAGGLENGETAEDTARRETREEIGLALPQEELTEHTYTKGSASRGVAGNGASAVSLPVPVGAPSASPNGNGEFTTFIQRVGHEFTPELNEEHDGWAWAPVSSPPGPLHPGCQIALDRLSMDELGVARAIAAGTLASPQKYENVWLFALRITGTGAAYRDKLDEFVIRDADIHLHPDALARLNGLPVIYKHPKKSLLDATEFSNRIVGTVFLPYVAGDEVWAIAKIFVDDVAEMMAEGGLSTSPGVNFADFSVNAKLTLEDGSKVLVEGKPSLFDHVAICELGVWDKGEHPSGIRAESREDSVMADEDKKERDDKKRDDAHRDDKKRDDTAKKDGDLEIKHEGEEREDKKRDDADVGKELDKDLSHVLLDAMKKLTDSVGSIGKRMDAIEEIEKKREDAKRDDAKRDDAKRDDDDARDDKKRDDADEGKEEAKELAAKQDKAKKDAKRDDAYDDKKRDDTKRDDSALSDRLRRVESEAERLARVMPKDMNDDDYAALVDAQARADDVFQDFGLRAPRPQQGETPSMYERRCVRMLQDHSPTWKGKNVTTAFTDAAAFEIVRDQVYKEARADAANPQNIPDGRLHMVEKRRDGHIVREFYGHPRNWMSSIAGHTQLRATGDWNKASISGK